jgi:hypothetical protein
MRPLGNEKCRIHVIFLRRTRRFFKLYDYIKDSTVYTSLCITSSLHNCSINLSHYPLNDDFSTFVGLVIGPLSKRSLHCRWLWFECSEKLGVRLIVTPR